MFPPNLYVDPIEQTDLVEILTNLCIRNTHLSTQQPNNQQLNNEIVQSQSQTEPIIQSSIPENKQESNNSIQIQAQIETEPIIQSLLEESDEEIIINQKIQELTTNTSEKKKKKKQKKKKNKNNTLLQSTITQSYNISSNISWKTTQLNSLTSEIKKLGNQVIDCLQLSQVALIMKNIDYCIFFIII